jgi:hypothetical protein
MYQGIKDRSMPTPAQSEGTLAPYAAKRSFEHTPEPLPAARGSARGPLLFVVQQHAARRMHFDFRRTDGAQILAATGLAIAPGKHLRS